MIRTCISAACCLALLATLSACASDAVHGVTFLGDAAEDAPDPGDIGTPVDGTKILSDVLCAQENHGVGLEPLDMLLLLDTSYSMDFDTKWLAVKSATKSFVNNKSFVGLGVGIQYFPLRKQCNFKEYGVPAVAISSLPGPAASITASLDKQRMQGGTPMVPALSGAITYNGAWMTSNPTRRAVVVLATDGIPDNTCLVPSAGLPKNTLANVVKLAKDGDAADPSVSTFVIGVGSELKSLDQIAVAGGTNKAILMDISKNVEAAFLKALNDIRLQASCEFKIPKATSGKIDFTQVEVKFKIKSTSEDFRIVKDRSACPATADGWFYDDPKAPKKIILCDNTCAKVQASDDGKLDIRFGCVYIPS